MPDRDPKMPRTQTSAPVSREKPHDVRDDARQPFQADAEEGRPSRRDDDAAGGDRGITE